MTEKAIPNVSSTIGDAIDGPLHSLDRGIETIDTLGICAMNGERACDGIHLARSMFWIAQQLRADQKTLRTMLEKAMEARP